MNPYYRLVSNVTQLAAEKAEDKGITVDNDTIEKTVKLIIGNFLIGENETVDPKSVKVSEEVALNVRGIPCRNLSITFSTRQFRIAKSNMLVLLASHFDPSGNPESRWKVGGMVRELGWSITETVAVEFIVGDSAALKSNRKDLDAEYAQYRTSVASFEINDVFVVVKDFKMNAPVVYHYDTPDRHRGYDDQPLYESTAKHIPKVLDTIEVEWLYPCNPVKGWFGLSTTYERDKAAHAVAGKIVVRKQERDKVKYNHGHQLLDEAALALLQHSWSFDPLALHELTNCYSKVL